MKDKLQSPPLALLPLFKKELLVITGIHLSVPFFKNGMANLEVYVQAYGKGKGEPKKRTNSVVVAKTLDHTQADDQVTTIKFIAKGDFLHGVSAIPPTAMLQTSAKNIVSTFRLARVADRFVKESEEIGPTLSIIRPGGQSGRSPNTLSYEQLGSCAGLL